MKKVIIIDDETRPRADLKSLVQAHCPELEFVGEADGVDTGEQLIRTVQPDAIFLDIEMRDGSGFDLLDRFDEYPFQVIFQTAFDEFAIKAFKYNAIDYLLKPISISELKKAAQKIRSTQDSSKLAQQLSNLLQQKQNKTPARIVLSTTEGLHFVALSDIIRLQADGNYTTFFLHSGEQIVVSKIIKYFEELLPSDAFFRTHQSHMVQLHFVKKVLRENGDYAIMGDESRVPISRNCKGLFIKTLKDKATHL